MARIAAEAIRRYERMGLSKLVRLARAGDYAEVRTEGGYDVAVTCVLDDSRSEDAVRVLASVNRRSSLLSFMFPYTRAALVVKELC